MSKMGQTIVDIQERYYNGQTIDQIVIATRTAKSFVEGIIEDAQRYDKVDTYADYPESNDDLEYEYFYTGRES
jgi:hypothetical protein